MAPLAAFRGQKPPAPAWFERVIAIEPERAFVAVDGAQVETLAWGERGKPGLILLHGGAAREAGAYDSGPPVVVGHSFGGRIAAGLAHDFGDELAAAVMVDPPFFAPQNQRSPSPPRSTTREHSVRPSLEAIIARFRLAPPQACDNLFILDFIARRSARKAVGADGAPGWSLSFDPHFWEKFGRLDP